MFILLKEIVQKGDGRKDHIEADLILQIKDIKTVSRNKTISPINGVVEGNKETMITTYDNDMYIVKDEVKDIYRVLLTNREGE